MAVLNLYTVHVFYRINILIMLSVALLLCISTSGSYASPQIPSLLLETMPDKREVINNLVPHRAVYSISLIAKDNSSQILDVQGKMYYELTATCSGWVTNHRFNMLYSYVDVGEVSLQSSFSTYESFDGTEFDFTSRRKKDGELVDEYRGNIVENVEQSMQAIYTTPKDLEIDMPSKTIFPIKHTIMMLDKARRGNDRFYNANVFDGSDDTGAYNISTFFTKEAKNLSKKIKINDKEALGLLPLPANKLRLAFFPVKDPQTLPEYEMSFVLHKDGIVSSMQVEYPDFAIEQNLTMVEAINWPDCK